MINIAWRIGSSSYTVDRTEPGGMFVSTNEGQSSDLKRSLRDQPSEKQQWFDRLLVICICLRITAIHGRYWEIFHLPYIACHLFNP